jgi:hypothetical protein
MDILLVECDQVSRPAQRERIIKTLSIKGTPTPVRFSDRLTGGVRVDAVILNPKRRMVPSHKNFYRV